MLFFSVIIRLHRINGKIFLISMIINLDILMRLILYLCGGGIMDNNMKICVVNNIKICVVILCIESLPWYHDYIYIDFRLLIFLDAFDRDLDSCRNILDPESLKKCFSRWIRITLWNCLVGFWFSSDFFL